MPRQDFQHASRAHSLRKARGESAEPGVGAAQHRAALESGCRFSAYLCLEETLTGETQSAN